MSDNSYDPPKRPRGGMNRSHLLARVGRHLSLLKKPFPPDGRDLEVAILQYLKDRKAFDCKSPVTLDELGSKGADYHVITALERQGRIKTDQKDESWQRRVWLPLRDPAAANDECPDIDESSEVQQPTPADPPEEDWGQEIDQSHYVSDDPVTAPLAGQVQKPPWGRLQLEAAAKARKRKSDTPNGEGPSQFPVTAEDAIQTNGGNPWATQKQLEMLTGRTGDAIRARINRELKKKNVRLDEKLDRKEVVYRKSGDPKYTYSIRAVWPLVQPDRSQPHTDQSVDQSK